MAWKVIGFMHGRDRVGKLPPIYGPLPCKIWIKRPGERKARMPKAKNALVGSDGRTKREINQRMAIDYAIWLARRDGVTLSGSGRALWAHVVLPSGKVEDRISCVMFNGGTRVDIPNWDWQPAEPVETIVPLDEAFEDLGKRAMASLLDCLMAA